MRTLNGFFLPRISALSTSNVLECPWMALDARTHALVWHWMPLDALDALRWHWLPIDGNKCPWMALNSLGWHWMPLDGIKCPWMVLNALGWH